MSKLIKKNNNYILTEYNPNLVNEMLLDSGESLDVKIELIDKRLISEQQRKSIFALCKEIVYYTGDDYEYIRLLMANFNANLRGIEIQSLSNCSVTYANGLIDTIINYCIDNEIPFAKELLTINKYSFDEKQVYMMCLKRMCCISGQRADLHHIDTIGMGNDRKKISHIGKRVLPLSREYHNLAHKKGNDWLINEYHLTPVVIDAKLEYFIKNGKIKEFKE